MTPPLVASAPWETLAVCLLLLAAPTVAVLHRPVWWLLAGMAGSIAASLFAGDGVTAYLIVAVGSLLHAAHAVAPVASLSAMWLAWLACRPSPPRGR